ncbi:MAG: hypothetical protein IT258_15065 [Saprospiraceae bacterium]|nr:hypothetical protein [Saprospiraceae bacterium]
MKAIHWFYLGAGIDGLAMLIAIYFVISDSLNSAQGTNNPSMYKVLLAMGALITAAFLLKDNGKIGFANALLWIPGIPLAGYGLMILAFIIFKPDMR